MANNYTQYEKKNASVFGTCSVNRSLNCERNALMSAKVD